MGEHVKLSQSIVGTFLKRLWESTIETVDGPTCETFIFRSALAEDPMSKQETLRKLTRSLASLITNTVSKEVWVTPSTEIEAENLRSEVKSQLSLENANRTVILPS